MNSRSDDAAGETWRESARGVQEPHELGLAAGAFTQDRAAKSFAADSPESARTMSAPILARRSSTLRLAHVGLLSAVLAACGGGGGGYSGGTGGGGGGGGQCGGYLQPPCGGNGGGFGGGNGGQYVANLLVSDTGAGALHTDANLVNAWGLAFNPNGFGWVSDAGTGVSTLYDGDGAQQSPTVSLDRKSVV